MTQGQKDYEADIIKKPFYHDGTPRPNWNELHQIAKDNWNRKTRDYAESH